MHEYTCASVCVRGCVSVLMYRADYAQSACPNGVPSRMRNAYVGGCSEQHTERTVIKPAPAHTTARGAGGDASLPQASECVLSRYE